MTVPAIRERMVASLRNVSEELAAAVASGLGLDPMPKAMPRALKSVPAPEVRISPALSLTALPGTVGIRTRKVAILVADGVEAEPLRNLAAELTRQGAIVRLLGARLGGFTAADGTRVEVDGTFENHPSVLFDGAVLPDGPAACAALALDGRVAEFIKDQFRHGKTVLALGAAAVLLEGLGIPATLPTGGRDPGVVIVDPREEALFAKAFIKALANHRHPQRETDPPRV